MARTRFRKLALLAAVMAAPACADEVQTTPSPETTGGQVRKTPSVSWEAFKAFAEKNTRIVNGEKIYIVEWDIPIRERDLRAYYVRTFVETKKSTVDGLNSGADNVWAADMQLELSYCVSTGFGSDYARMQAEMADATWAWAREANVLFHYKSSEDSNCNDANTAVEIPLVPFSGGGACAFFPNQDGQPSCTGHGRALVINVASVDAWPSQEIWGEYYPNVSTFGTLQHELGHIIGMRHEHIREMDNAVANCVGEVSSPGNHRALTEYDQNSSMHYPWCGGLTTATQNVTALDGEGANSLYGVPAWYVAFL
jgi:hypothetical protein